jgi:hypothetical protein
MLYSAMPAIDNRIKTKKAAEGSLDFFDMIDVVIKIIYYFQAFFLLTIGKVVRWFSKTSMSLGRSMDASAFLEKKNSFPLL